MATVVSYLDESFSTNAYVVAGYVASRSTWDDHFVPAWQAVLGDAGIEEFKSSDARHQRGVFRTWTREAVNRLTARFVDVILHSCPNSDMVGIGFAFLGWDPGDRAVNRALYGMSAGIVYYELLKLLTHRRFNADLEIVMDERDKFYEKMQESFDVVRTLIQDRMLGKARPPIPADSKTVLPLQAADVLAYEIRKEVLNRVAGRPVSTALERLVSGRFHSASVLDTPWMLEDRRRASVGLDRIGPVVLFETGRPIRDGAELWLR